MNSLIVHISELDDKLREMILDNMKNNIFCSPLNIRQAPIFNGEVSGTSGPKPNLYRTQDPLFVNTGPGGLVYRIQSNSPARDAGAVIPGITVGYVGTAPDIGAYENGGEEWVAGHSDSLYSIQVQFTDSASGEIIRGLEVNLINSYYFTNDEGSISLSGLTRGYYQVIMPDIR